MANRRMKRIGVVVRDANDKTIVVAYTWSQRHRLYKRSRRRITKFVAHDELNQASIGDRVEIEECRPYSATKRWRLVRIIAQVDVVTATEAPDVVSEVDVETEAAEDAPPTAEAQPEDSAPTMTDESESSEQPEEPAPDAQSDAPAADAPAPETQSAEPAAEAQTAPQAAVDADESAATAETEAPAAMAESPAAEIEAPAPAPEAPTTSEQSAVAPPVSEGDTPSETREERTQ